MYTNGTPLTQTLRHNILVVWPKSLFINFCGKTQTNLLANSILNHSPNLGTEVGVAGNVVAALLLSLYKLRYIYATRR